MDREIKIALVGLGHVGRAVLALIEQKSARLQERYGLVLTVTAACDTSGGILDVGGIDLRMLMDHKHSGLGAAQLAGGVAGLDAPSMVAVAEADVLLEASTVNQRTGQPGLDCVRVALRRGMGVVLANKGPLVHAFGELSDLAQAQGTGLAYSATVCGALPVLAIGRRDLVGCDFRSVRGVFNSTSNYILTAMHQGVAYEEALRQAQLEGVAETDPSLDVEGWDTANKLVIVTNSILRQPAMLDDVSPVTGIQRLDMRQVREQAAQDRIVKLVATAEKQGDRFALSVKPEWLPRHDFLAGVNGWEMGIVFDTDIMGVQQFKVDERGPVPTAAAMLRDLINLFRV